MRLVYFGTSSFAVPALRRMSGSIVLAVSQPDRPAGRGLRLRPSSVKEAAAELGIPVETPERCREPAFVDRIRSLGADALLVAAYGQILPAALLESAPGGAINLHGSILPAHRGAAPIQRAILAGETETGVTLMRMDRGMDTGPILAVRRLAIGPDETYGELHDRLADLAADLAAEELEAAVGGQIEAAPQDESLATYAPKVEKAEAELSWDRAVSEEYNRFRAFAPAPGPFVRTRFGTVRVDQARRSGPLGDKGRVLRLDPLTIGWSGGSMEWLALRPEGKTRMTGREWANGLRLAVGDPLTPMEKS